MNDSSQRLMAGLTPRVMALSMKGRVYTRTNAGWTFRDCRANSNRPSKALAVLSKARKRPKEARFRANEGEPPPESDLKSEQDGSSRGLSEESPRATRSLFTVVFTLAS